MTYNCIHQFFLHTLFLNILSYPVNRLVSECFAENTADRIRVAILDFIAEDPKMSEIRVLQCLITGVAYLDIYCQVRFIKYQFYSRLSII